MSNRQVRRTQSAPHLTTTERRRVQMALVEGTLYIRRRQALSREDNFIMEEDEENEEQPMMSTSMTRSECTSSVSSLASEGSVVNGVKESSSRRVRILTNPHGKKGGLRVSQEYNSQSSLSGDSDSLVGGAVRRREQRRDNFNKRHTLVGVENAEDLENLTFAPNNRPPHKVRESPLIMEYLKRKYPEHSDRIQGRPAEEPVNGVFCETDLDNMDNTDTMSEINTEATGFSRGGRLRSSMPVIRPSVNMTKERPLGLVYLQYKNETKRGLMPNEVTGIDTVRALYVRAFPKQLNMEMLEQPVRKIYIKDPTTEIFYELEDVNEIHDRTILKIYEPGFVEDPNAPGPSSPRSTTSTPVELDYYSEPEVDHQKRDIRKNRYNTMTLPRNMHFSQMEGEGAKPAPVSANLNPSPEKQPHSQSLENFRRGVPERSSATLQRPAAHAQAFQRLTPERATLGGPVNRGPGGGPHPQGPYGRRGQPHPNQQRGSATMPRRMPPPSQHEGGGGGGPGGPRPQGGSSTLPRQHQRGGPAVVDGGSRPSSGDMVSRSQNSTPVTKVMQNQVMSAPMPNGHPRQRGPPPPQQHHQTPPGRPQGGTLPRNGAPGMRQPIPNGMGPQHRGQPPLRRHGSHDGTFSHGRPQSAPSVDGAVGPRPGVHPGAGQRPFSQPVTRTPNRPQPGEEGTSERISAMEQQIANLAGMVRSVIGTHNGAPRPGKPQDATQRPPGERPTPPTRTDSAPVPARTSTPQQQPPHQPSSRTPIPQPQPQPQQQTRAPIPQQQARPPGPQSPRPSSHPGTPGVPGGRPGTTHPGGVNVQRSAMVIRHRTTDLRMQLKQIRKMHLNMVQQMNNNFRSTSHKIRLALEGAPGTDNHPIRNQRARVHQEYIKYMQTQEMIERDLRLLDENVEKLRDKTINNRGSVDMDSLEQQAQILGNCSRGIAEQKVNFPVLSEKLKTVQEGEMEVVVREENWMKHEPQILDDHFKRCKKITSTLYTLKRMAATNDEPYIVSPSSPTIASTVAPTITPTVTSSRQVVRVESAPLPTSLEVKREIVDHDQEPIIHHDLPQRFKSPVERDHFETTLSGQKDGLRRTNNAEAAQTRQRRFLRELFDQENHDTMTPIITQEKAAKREALKEAGGGQKKGPPPPPPPRKHFPASPAPGESNKKITWSSPTSTSQHKVPTEEVVVEAKVESESEPVVESMPESESHAVKGRVEGDGRGGGGGAEEVPKPLSVAPSTSADCLINAVTAAVDPPQITSTIKAQETSKSTPSLGVTESTTPKEINGTFHSQTLVTVGNGGVAHSNGKAGKEKSQTKRSFLSRSPSKSGQQGSSSNNSGKSKSKKMGGALARLLRRDHEKGDSSQKANSPGSSEVGPPPKPPRGCMDSPTQRAKKLLVTATSESNINNNAKQITIPERPGQHRSSRVTNQGRMAKSAENICLSSSPENDLYPPEGIYNVQQQQIIQDPDSAHSSPVRNPVIVSLSGPRRTLSDSAGQLPRTVPPSAEIKRRETDPAVRPKKHQLSLSAGNDEQLRTIQLKAQYAKLRQMQLQNIQKKPVQTPEETKQVNGPSPQATVTAILKPSCHEDQPATPAAMTNKPEEHQLHGSGGSPQHKEIKSPPPVAAKPPSTKKAIKTTTTTVTTQSYHLADVDAALDDLESLMVRATDTNDMDDSNIIQESTPSTPNGTIQKPVHAHIRLPQSPPRNFATKPKPLSPKGESAIGKVGGKSSAFKPIKKASSPTTKSGVASLSISLSKPSTAPSTTPLSNKTLTTSNKPGQSQEPLKLQCENSGVKASTATPKSPEKNQAVTIVLTDATTDIQQTKLGDVTKKNENDVKSRVEKERTESELSETDIDASEGETSPARTKSVTETIVTNGEHEPSKSIPEEEKVSETNTGDKKEVMVTPKDESSKSDYVTEIKTTFVNGIIEETFIN